MSISLELFVLRWVGVGAELWEQIPSAAGDWDGQRAACWELCFGTGLSAALLSVAELSCPSEVQK